MDHLEHLYKDFHPQIILETHNLELSFMTDYIIWGSWTWVNV